MAIQEELLRMQPWMGKQLGTVVVRVWVRVWEVVVVVWVVMERVVIVVWYLCVS